MILLFQSTYDGINILIIESESTITFTGAEISGIQTSISSLFSILQKKNSDLPKPTHIFIILNSAAVGRQFVISYLW